jgi:hypothetical protein
MSRVRNCRLYQTILLQGVQIDSREAGELNQVFPDGTWVTGPRPRRALDAVARVEIASRSTPMLQGSWRGLAWPM